MATLIRTWFVALLLATSACAQVDAWDRMENSHDWFGLRDAVTADASASAYYRGVVAYSFHKWTEAENLLREVMASTDQNLAFGAWFRLHQMYNLAGRRADDRAALARAGQLLKGKDRRKVLSVFAPLKYPDTAITARGYSRLEYKNVDGHIDIPLTINGHAANYTIDTGAQVSAISAAEAKRLGLRARNSHAGVAMPDREPFAVKTALADVVIGNFHFHNLLFAVTPGDEVNPGIIGLPVLLAMETVRWTADGVIEFGFPARPPNVAEANLCLSDSQMLVAVDAGLQRLALTLDTGSPESVLFQASADSKTAMRVGDFPGILLTTEDALSSFKPNEGSAVAGLLGTDFFEGAGAVKLDFVAMRMTIEPQTGVKEGANLASPRPTPITH